jgi:hypothetical protein
MSAIGGTIRRSRQAADRTYSCSPGYGQGTVRPALAIRHCTLRKVPDRIPPYTRAECSSGLATLTAAMKAWPPVPDCWRILRARARQWQQLRWRIRACQARRLPGHEWGPGKVIVGCMPCKCALGHRRHPDMQTGDSWYQATGVSANRSLTPGAKRWWPCRRRTSSRS